MPNALACPQSKTNPLMKTLMRYNFVPKKWELFTADTKYFALINTVVLKNLEISRNLPWNSHRN